MKKILSIIVGAVLLASSLTAYADLPAVSRYYKDTNSFITEYYTAIEFITDEGIVNGYSDGTYRPDVVLNRAELLKIVLEARYDVFEFKATENCFSDVPQDEWFAKYVCFAKGVGIVNGYDDGSFRPADEINFVEALKIMVETFGYEYESSTPWYKNIVNVASDGEKDFIPYDVVAFDQKFTRGQMADMITRVVKYRRGELSDYLGDVKFRANYDTILKGVNVKQLSSSSGLLATVCGGESHDCDAEKQAVWGCSDAYEVSYGDYDFVKCGSMYFDREEDEGVLIMEGGLGAYGYNLIALDGNDIVVLDTQEKLRAYFGGDVAEKDLISYMRAATGRSAAYNVEDLEQKIVGQYEIDNYGIDYTDAFADVYYTQVWGDADGKFVVLYDYNVFGCSPFSLTEYVYKVTSGVDGTEFAMDRSNVIGTVDNGMCID